MPDPGPDVPTAPAGVWKFEPVDRVVFGPGSIASVPESVERFGARRAFVVTSPSLVATGFAGRLAALLGDRYADTFSAVRPHLPAENLIEAVDAARGADADVLVCIGAGSSIDAAKLVAVGLREKWGAVDDIWRSKAEGFDADHALAPVIAIPTTLMGAEVTAGAGVTDAQERKTVFFHPRLAPDVIVLDPEVALATPTELWASSGVKAIDRTVDRLTSPDRQPLTVAVARDSFRRLMEHLPPSVVRDDATVAHRGHCLVGSWLASFGAHNATWGLSIVLSRHLGARCHVPHTLTSCITLPHSVRYLAGAHPERMVDLADAMGVDADRADLGDVLADRLTDMIRELGLPYRLRDVGYTRGHEEAIGLGASQELVGSLEIPPADVEAILEGAW